MENLQNYKNQIKEVESLVIKLENGELNLEGLAELELLTRKIHERSIILQYKAYEQSSIVEKGVMVEVAIEELEEFDIPNDAPEETVEEPTIDFSMFNMEESAEAPKTIEETQEGPNEEEVIEETPVEKVAEKIVVELKDVEPPQAAGVSFLDSFKVDDNSLNAQFNGAKIDTLVGAFGLNEKLRYINELFDGSSESFSDAIKSLDSKSSLDEAKGIVTKLAAEHEWDSEEESVIEFMAVLNRRYA
ncbi:MAG: hypothetical protein MK105_01550 [Crocinitomicaceae bacterium]|nr:hypothetical protein [Crocinitomicaceae bacterium]